MTQRNIPKSLSSGDMLRFTVQLCNGMRESFVQSFTCLELVTLAQAYMVSEDDIAPDNWTDEQIEAALKGEF